jgi:hypothetical protein
MNCTRSGKTGQSEADQRRNGACLLITLSAADARFRRVDGKVGGRGGGGRVTASDLLSLIDMAIAVAGVTPPRAA